MKLFIKQNLSSLHGRLAALLNPRDTIHPTSLSPHLAQIQSHRDIVIFCTYVNMAQREQRDGEGCGLPISRHRK